MNVGLFLFSPIHTPVSIWDVVSLYPTGNPPGLSWSGPLGDLDTLSSWELDNLVVITGVRISGPAPITHALGSIMTRPYASSPTPPGRRVEATETRSFSPASVVECPNCYQLIILEVVIDCKGESSTMCPTCYVMVKLLDVGVMVNDEKRLCLECMWFIEQTRTILGRLRK